MFQLACCIAERQISCGGDSLGVNKESAKLIGIAGPLSPEIFAVDGLGDCQFFARVFWGRGGYGAARRRLPNDISDRPLYVTEHCLKIVQHGNIVSKNRRQDAETALHSLVNWNGRLQVTENHDRRGWSSPGPGGLVNLARVDKIGVYESRLAAIRK